MFWLKLLYLNTVSPLDFQKGPQLAQDGEDSGRGDSKDSSKLQALRQNLANTAKDPQRWVMVSLWKKNLFHVPFGSRNGITSYIFLVDISNRNYRYIYIYTLWLSNIAMEAMAHRNRWFTCLKNGGSFPHNQMVDIFGNRNHRFRSPRCWIHWDCGGRIVREPRFGASIGSDPGLL